MLGDCWFCHRSYEDAQQLISEFPSEARQFFLDAGKQETVAPICPICQFLMKTLFIKFRTEELQREQQLLQQRNQQLKEELRQKGLSLYEDQTQ